MTLKAYHIHDKENSGEEACHEIVFAETAAQAKYNSEAYSNGVPWTDISAVRKPQFDQYAEAGIIPKSAYIADGWYFECDVCGSFSATNEVEGKVLCDSCSGSAYASLSFRRELCRSYGNTSGSRPQGVGMAIGDGRLSSLGRGIQNAH